MSKPSLIDQLDRAIDELLARPGVALRSGEPEIAALLPLAAALSEVPRPGFKDRLRNVLEREAMMSKTGVDPIPAGFQTITPYLVAADAAQLIEFVKAAFGAEERYRTIGSAGGIHCVVRIGESMMMIGGGGGGTSWQGEAKPAAIHIFVDNVDDVFRRAVAAGAASVVEPADLPYGERLGCVRDASGTEWYVASPLGADPRPEGFRTFAMYFHPAGAAQFIEFLRQAFGAAEVVRYDSPEGAVLHAKLRIGDAIVEIGEAHDQWQSMPTMVYMYVPNVDAAYERLIRAGGKSLMVPTDQSYGARSAGVEDPFGHQWYIAANIGQGS